jgi:hypothetical protein
VACSSDGQLHTEKGHACGGEWGVLVVVGSAVGVHACGDEWHEVCVSAVVVSSAAVGQAGGGEWWELAVGCEL